MVTDARPLRGLRVLVVDDDVDIRDMLALVLEEAGLVVDAAGSVVDAVAAIGRAAPHLVITDIGLPGGESGVDLLRRLRSVSATRGIPVIALTGTDMVDDGEHPAKYGFDVRLTKPADLDNLLAAIGRALRLQSTRLQARSPTA